MCPHCGDAGAGEAGAHVHADARSSTCPKCKKPFRPGGPWPADDPELPTAKQASERFEVGRNFANKLWNAARFLLMNLDGYTPGAGRRSTSCRSRTAGSCRRLATTAKAVTEQLEGYHFSEVARTHLRLHLVGVLRLVHRDEQGPAARTRPARPLAQRVLVGVLDGILRLVQPVMPFVAESLWQALNEAAPSAACRRPAKAAESVVHRAVAELPRRRGSTPAMETALRPDAGPGARRPRGAQPLQVDREDARSTWR